MVRTPGLSLPRLGSGFIVGTEIYVAMETKRKAQQVDPRLSAHLPTPVTLVQYIRNWAALGGS